MPSTNWVERLESGALDKSHKRLQEYAERRWGWGPQQARAWAWRRVLVEIKRKERQMAFMETEVNETPEGTTLTEVETGYWWYHDGEEELVVYRPDGTVAATLSMDDPITDLAAAIHQDLEDQGHG